MLKHKYKCIGGNAENGQTKQIVLSLQSCNVMSEIKSAEYRNFNTASIVVISTYITFIIRYYHNYGCLLSEIYIFSHSVEFIDLHIYLDAHIWFKQRTHHKYL